MDKFVFASETLTTISYLSIQMIINTRVSQVGQLVIRRTELPFLTVIMNIQRLSIFRGTFATAEEGKGVVCAGVIECIEVKPLALELARSPAVAGEARSTTDSIVGRACKS